jgi:Domain of unknown function (DUF4365)
VAIHHPELDQARSNLEGLLQSGATPEEQFRARAEICVHLVALADHTADHEARFHLTKLSTDWSMVASSEVQIVERLLNGDTDSAFDLLNTAAARRTPGSAYLPLVWSTVVRGSGSAEQIPWLPNAIASDHTCLMASVRFLEVIKHPVAMRHAILEVALRNLDALRTTSSDQVSVWSNALYEALMRCQDHANLAVFAASQLRESENPRDRLSYRLLEASSLLEAENPVEAIRATVELLSELEQNDDSIPNWHDGTVCLAEIAIRLARRAEIDQLGSRTVECLTIASRALALAEGCPASQDAAGDSVVQRLQQSFNEISAAMARLHRWWPPASVRNRPSPIDRFATDRKNASPTSRPDRVARLAEATFAKECAKADWKLVQTPLEVDYGIDYRVEIPNSPGRTSPDVEFLVQLKGTNQAPGTGGHQSVRVASKTIGYWNSKLLPLMVVLVDVQTDEVFAVWYDAAPVHGESRAFVFGPSDRWDPVRIRMELNRFYTAARASLRSGGQWSFLTRLAVHSSALVKLLYGTQKVVEGAVRQGEANEGLSSLLHAIDVTVRIFFGPQPQLAALPGSENILQSIEMMRAIFRASSIPGKATERVQYGWVELGTFNHYYAELIDTVVDLNLSIVALLSAIQEQEFEQIQL